MNVSVDTDGGFELAPILSLDSLDSVTTKLVTNETIVVNKEGVVSSVLVMFLVLGSLVKSEIEVIEEKYVDSVVIFFSDSVITVLGFDINSLVVEESCEIPVVTLLSLSVGSIGVKWSSIGPDVTTVIGGIECGSDAVVRGVVEDDSISIVAGTVTLEGRTTMVEEKPSSTIVLSVVVGKTGVGELMFVVGIKLGEILVESSGETL